MKLEMFLCTVWLWHIKMMKYKINVLKSRQRAEGKLSAPCNANIRQSYGALLNADNVGLFVKDE